MPTLSASDYTQYLKFKAASLSGIRPAIQTRDNVSTNQSVINANLLTSQAALVTTPYSSKVLTNAATVSAASSTTLTDALTNIISGAIATTTTITYTCSIDHGLTTGDVVQIDGFGGTLSPDPNTLGAVNVTGSNTFTISSSGTGLGTATGTGRIIGRVYYTTSVVHGLTAGMSVSITGLSTFNTTNASVLTVPTSTTFALSNTTTGTAETGKTGTISEYVYYTTSAAHGLDVLTKNVSVSGLSTAAFNFSLLQPTLVPSSTVFVIQSGATGTAVTGATGVLTVTLFANTTTAIRSNARVQALQEVQTRSTNKAKSTISWTSGTSGSVSTTTSSKFQQPGGLPANNRVGTYTRLPQNAGWGH